jgi:hypothetical protein
MKGLPSWMLLGLLVLTVLLVVFGWQDRHEAGPIPYLMGIVFALFTLAAIGAKARGEDEG